MPRLKLPLIECCESKAVFKNDWLRLLYVTASFVQSFATWRLPFFFFFFFPSLVLSGSIHFSGISAKFARDPGWDAEDPRISHFFAPLTMQQVRGLAGCRQNSPPRAIVMTATVWLQNKVVEDTEELGGERCHRERIKLSFFDCCGDINFVVLNGIPPTN